MSYSSTDPQYLLAQKSWRMRRSRWLWWAILGFGMFAWIGFVYAALRVRTRPLQVAAIIVGVASAVMWVVFSVDSDPALPGVQAASAAGGVLLFLWVGEIVYASILNRDYLAACAIQEARDAQYLAAAVPVAPTLPAQTVAPMWAAPPTLNTVAPQASYPPPVPQVQGQSSAYAVPPLAASAPSPQPAPQATVLDINQATVDQLCGLGLSSTTSQSIVSERARRGGFASQAELVATVPLAPHELVRLQGRHVEFGSVAHGSAPVEQQPLAPKPGQRGVPGRTLDY